jgi:galactokinase/mevalonate kinase-like predicted kinase
LKTEGRKTLKQKEKEQKDLELQLKHKKREMKTKLLKEELESTEDVIQMNYQNQKEQLLIRTWKRFKREQ